jgi:hypothetical protein
MNKLLLLLFLTSIYSALYSQKYVDTLYQITTEENISYGEAVNFAGETKDLLLDISYPTNDTLGTCGRPMALIIHGGAFAAGSKNDNSIARLRQDYAKRGYVAVAINYRLGYFPTDVAKNCNIPNWNCLNLADSSEWIRAWYRGVQDAKGALRYMLNNKQDYDIDASNIFVFGESAGAFISYGVGFLDYWEEKPADCYALDDVPQPHQNYNSPCIQGSAYEIPIEEMDLSRPDLGSIHGGLNPTNEPYVIKGVGSMYGGTFTNLFEQFDYYQAPKLYMFHQPNDLIVPINANKVFAEFNTCAMATNCVSIQDRPLVYGGQGVDNMINDLSFSSQYIPEVLFESTNNSSDCLGQVANPSTGGHQYDSFWNRTRNMAAFFAQDIDENDCSQLATQTFVKPLNVNAYPNPSDGRIKLSHDYENLNLSIISLQGKLIKTFNNVFSNEEINVSFLNDGVYLLQIETPNRKVTKRITIANGK